MALDFDTNLLTLYSTNVENDIAYGKEFAIVTGTVAFATPNTNISSLSSGNNFIIYVNELDSIVSLTTNDDGNVTLNTIVDDFSESDAAVDDGIVASTVETSSGWVLQIRATKFGEMNSFRLEDGTGTPLNTLGISIGTFTGSGESGVIDSLRVDERSEQRLLTTVEIIRSYIETLRDRDEAKMANLVIARFASGARPNNTDDAITSVTGNVKIPTFAANSGIDVTVGDATNQINFIAGGSLENMVSAINSQLPLVNVSGETDLTGVTLLDDISFTIRIADGSVINVNIAIGKEIDDLIIAINNSLAVQVPEVEVYNNNNRLAFRNTIGNEGTPFTLGNVVGASVNLRNQAGYLNGTYNNSIIQVEAYNNNGYLGFRNTTGNEGTAFTLGNGTNPGSEAQFIHDVGINPGENISEVTRMTNQSRDSALSYFSNKPRSQSL